MNLRISAAAFIAAIGMLSTTGVHAWKLSPQGSFVERKLAEKQQSFYDRALGMLALWGVHVIGESVHEEITNRLLGCEGDENFCGSPEHNPEYAFYLAGVRWNDDPPFRFAAGSGNFLGCAKGQTVRFVTQPMCWASTFKDGAKRAASGTKLDGSNATLLVRSHFGDMQFLHSMASEDDELPQVTRDKILAWAEFTWRVATFEYDAEQAVAALPIAGFAELFSRNKEWRIQDLFALGNQQLRSREAISKVAFGSLLHMVQDSFAAGHTERREPAADKRCTDAPDRMQPGRILEFHAYPRQDSSLHGVADSRESFSAHWSAHNPSVVTVGRELHALYKAQAKWEAVAPYIRCIFATDDQARPASPGSDFGM